MDAPKRIWARPEHEDESSYGGFWIKEPVEAGATEYTRTDLTDAAVEAALGQSADRIKALEAKLAKAVDLLRRADQQIVWESLGLGNTFSEEVEATLAELTGGNDD